MGFYVKPVFYFLIGGGILSLVPYFLYTLFLVNKELIERFFQKKCTSKEAKLVSEYLKANPVLLEKYVSESEWNSIKPGTSLHDENWIEIWNKIQKNNKAKIISLQLKRVTAAASVILIIALLCYNLIPQKQITHQLSNIKVLPKTEQRTALNTTKKIIQLILEDSSVVMLQPNSSIKYDVPFPENKREIFLDGDAKFTVAKNKNKPFTVYSGVLATTALGTIFSVKTNKNKKDITVKLFRGKVVIHSTNNISGWQKDIYLMPGEQMKYSADKMLVDVEKMLKPIPVNINKIKKPETDSASDILSFNNTKLPAVMQKLSAYYNIKINYDSLMLNSMNFTGTVSKTDSLPVILKAISQMNNLDVIQSGNEFIITKPQQ